MPLETATYPTQLVTSNPAATDSTNQGDDHLRLIKSVIQSTLPALNAPLTRSISGSYGVVAGAGTNDVPAYSFIGYSGVGFYAFGTRSVGLTGDLIGDGNVTVLGNVTAANGILGTLSVTGLISGATLGISGNGTVTGAFSAGTVSAGTVTGTTVVGAVPAGFIMDFAGTAAPTGWAVCDGQALSRTTYAQLFANIGSTWGAGDGSTTFNVPNLLSRFRRHRDGGTLAGPVGNFQGPVNISHTHTYSGTSANESNGHSHTYSGTSATENTNHTHAFGGTSSGISADHTHGVSLNTGGMSANATHSHTFGNPNGVFLAAINNGNLTVQGNVMVTSGGSAVTIVTNTADLSHTHSVSGSTGGASSDHTHTYGGTTGIEGSAHAHDYSGTTSDISTHHTHTYSGTTAATGDGNETRPYSATVLTCIKLFN